MQTPPTDSVVSSITAGKTGDELIRALLDNFHLLRPSIISSHSAAKSNECDHSFQTHTNKECDIVCHTCGMVVGRASPTYIAYGDLNTAKIHAYQRITRLREVMRNMQGDGAQNHPLELQMFIQHLRNSGRAISPAIVRRLLKFNKLGKFVEQANQICVMAGRDFVPLRFPQAVVLAMEAKFRQLDRVWPLVQRQLVVWLGIERSNFMSYSMVVYHLLLLVGQEKLAQSVLLCQIKNPHLAARQQLIWRLFCHHLDWHFNQMYGNLHATDMLNPPKITLPINVKPLETVLSDYEARACPLASAPILGFLRTLSRLPMQH